MSTIPTSAPTFPGAIPDWLTERVSVADLEAALSACLLHSAEEPGAPSSPAERLWQRLEASPVPTLVTDEVGVILYGNPAFEALSDYPCAELVGRTPRLFHSSAHDPEHYRALWEALHAGKSWRGFLVNRCRGGALCQCLVDIQPVQDAAGRTHHYVALYREVGSPWVPAKQAEMQAAAQLAAETVHDVNNLLTILSGYSQLLVEDLEPGTRTRHEAERILVTCRRAAELMRQLLLFSGRQAQDVEAVDLNDWLSEQAEALAEQTGALVQVEFGLGADAPEVLVDPLHLETVLANLVRNACQAMPEGGRLRLETHRVTLEGFAAARWGLESGAYGVLGVQDSGTGISPEVQGRMFEPFYSTKRGGVGSGMGLAAVYGLVRQIGGVVRVESESGHGTRMLVYLPCAHPADAG
jgi:two-component system, cell cycle sensor histidine kinase and response regulator CckA